MSIESCIPLARNFFEVISKPDEFVEVSFWTAMVGFDSFGFRASQIELREKNALPDADPKKVDQVSQARKNYFLSATSLISSSFMTIDWMNRTEIISLGILGPLTGGIGYGGRGLFALLNFRESGAAFLEKNTLYRQSQDPAERKELLKEQIRILMKIALQVTMAAWGIFGMIYVFSGAEIFFQVSDLAFFCWLLFFPVHLVVDSFLKKPLEVPLQNAQKV